MAGEATDAARVPGPSAVRMIVAGWLVVTAVVRLGVIGGGDSGWAAGPIAMMLLAFAVQSLFVVYGRQLRGTAAGWLLVAVQAVLTYLPWVLFGHDWMPGNSGILVAALLLAAGPLAGLPVALTVAAIDVALTVTVLHQTALYEVVYPVTASMDNGVQFWGLVTLTLVVEDLHAERAELARLAAADERSRAERTLRVAFGRRLLAVEEHVIRALRTPVEATGAAAAEVAAAVRVARECQESVRSAVEAPWPAGDGPADPAALAHPAASRPARTSRRGEANTQLIVIAALGMLLVNYCGQAVADAVDGYFSSLTVVGFAGVIFAAIAALRHHQDQQPVLGSRAAAWLHVVMSVGTVIFPVSLITVAALIHPTAAAWIGFGILVVSALILQARTGASWRRLFALIIVAMVVSLSVAPIAESTGANRLYLLSGAVALVVNTYGMVRLVQFEGALLSTRRQAVTLAALRERSRVARDVHDLLGLGITTIVLKAELAARLLDSEPERARKHLADVRQLAAEAAIAAGAITGTVEGRTTSLRCELRAGEQTLAEAGIAVDLAVAESPIPDTADAVFAVILREAVTNILRHSAPQKVRISLQTAAGRAVLEVENDGVPNTEAGPGGRGLRNIAARVAEAGGELDVRRADGRFSLSVDLGV